MGFRPVGQTQDESPIFCQPGHDPFDPARSRRELDPGANSSSLVEPRLARRTKALAQQLKQPRAERDIEHGEQPGRGGVCPTRLRGKACGDAIGSFWRYFDVHAKASSHPEPAVEHARFNKNARKLC